MIDDAELSKLNEQQLVELNNRVVERIRFLRQRRVHEELGRFSVGDLVTFSSECGQLVVGTVVRCNHKTVSIVGDDGHAWRVSPGLLSRVVQQQGPQSIFARRA
jgi:hypothetical protein